MKLNDTVKCMVDHPIASAFVIGAIAESIAKIIATAKGGKVKPIVTVTVDKKTKPNKE